MSETTDQSGGTESLSRAEWLGVFAFWTVMAVLTAANRLADQSGTSFSAVPRAVPISLAFQQMYLWALITPLVFWLAGRFSLEKSPDWAKVVMLVTIGVVLAYTIDLVDSTLVREFSEPMHGPRGRFPRVSHGPMLLNHFILFWGVLAAGFARDYFLRFRARERETARLLSETAQLQTQLAEAKLSALNAQLNPHFLFNTLNTVSALVERDPRGVRRMIARLSELLRYALDGRSDNEVALAREIDFLQRYVEIMEIRFEGKLEVEVQVGDDTRDALVPSLILQPLVENAVKHGVDRISVAGRIRIAARREDERLVMTVSDNGPGPARIARLDDAGVGLANIRQRLEQLYGSAAGLTLAESPSGGTVAQIVMPFRTRAELRTTIVSAEASR